MRNPNVDRDLVKSCRIAIAVEPPCAELLKKLALNKSKKERKIVTASDIVREAIRLYCLSQEEELKIA